MNRIKTFEMTASDGKKGRTASFEADTKPPLGEPWFEKAYVRAASFYEKDKILTKDDRIALRDIFDEISSAQTRAAIGGFAIGAGTPYAYSKYRYNSVKGVRPLRSALLGVALFFFSGTMCARMMYRDRLNSIRLAIEENDIGVDKSGLKRQYQVMRVVGPNLPRRWLYYYENTVGHPEATFGNPERRIAEWQSSPEKWGQEVCRMRKMDPFELYGTVPWKTMWFGKPGTH